MSRIKHPDAPGYKPVKDDSGKAPSVSSIARHVGVSTATVSRALNDPQRVREQTRNKILRAMEEQGYVYNALAGGLTGKKMTTIGLIIPTITNPVFALTTAGTQSAIRQKGYSMLLGSTEYNYDAELESIALFYEKRVDGIVFVGAPGNPLSLDFLKKKAIPFIVTWEVVADKEINLVAFNNVQIASHVTEYLISLGHRRIAMIAGPKAGTTRAHQRVEGYLKSMQANGLPVQDHWIIHRHYTVDDGKEAMKRLLEEAVPPTAVFCGNDILAFGAMAAAKEAGYRVGKDVSIVGFDDLEMSRMMDPQLTTVNIPAYRMGKIAGELIISMIGKEVLQPQQFILESTLIIRQSTGNPPSG
jgi:LacI family transcriptional regulator